MAETNLGSRLYDYIRSGQRDGDWFRLPGTLTDFEKSNNASSGYGATTIRQWAKQGRIEYQKKNPSGLRSPIVAVRFIDDTRPAKANGEVKAEPKERVTPADYIPTASSKEKVLQYLKDHVDTRGYFRGSESKARRQLGMSKHHFIKNLFDLKDQALISFNTVGQGNSMKPISIRVRPQAYVKREGLDLKKWPNAPDGAWESEEGWLVIGDMAFKPEEWVGAPGKQYRGEYDHRQESPPKEEEAKPIAEAEAEIVTTIQGGTPIDLEEPPAEPAWPLIEELLAKAHHLEKVAAAAQVLDDAGLNDLAIQAIEAGGTLSPLEKEVVQYWLYTHDKKE